MVVGISPEIFSLQRYGGISRYFVELRRALEGEGLAARIVAGRHMNGYLAQSAGVIGLRSAATRVPRLQRWCNEVLFQGWCRAQRDEVVVHRTYYVWTRRPRCARLVITVYDLIPELFPEREGTLGRESYLKRVACESADAICVISHTTAADLSRLWGIPRERVWVTPLGATRHAPSSTDWRARCGEYLLFVGQRAGYKNALLLFEAYGKSGIADHVSLLCFGGGPVTERERQMLRQLGVEKRVHFHSGSDADLAACYEQAIGFICPSRYEGFGLPVLEAMLQGCPVACSRAGSLPEVAGDAAIYFEPDDVDSVVQGIHALVGGRRAHADLIARGLVRASEYSWGNTARLTAMAYTGVRGSGLVVPQAEGDESAATL